MPTEELSIEERLKEITLKQLEKSGDPIMLETSFVND